MKGKKHPDSRRAQVVAALLLGSSVTECAEQFNLAHQTISNYKRAIPADKLSELGRKKGERLDELVYGYLVGSLVALQSQLKVMCDESYLRQQPAGELATLHGVMADKTVRFLAAATAGAVEPRQLTESGG